MSDALMLQVIEKLKASRKRSEDGEQGQQRKELIKKTQGPLLWRSLIEWTEKCCSLYDPSDALKFERATNNEFAVVFSRASQDVRSRVRFDPLACTISYRREPSAVMADAARASIGVPSQSTGTFVPEVVGESLSFTEDKTFRTVSVPEIGEIIMGVLS
jgi:hypothetical protein